MAGHPVEEEEGAGVVAEAAQLLDEGEELGLGGGPPLAQPGRQHGLHRLLLPGEAPEERRSPAEAGAGAGRS